MNTTNFHIKGFALGLVLKEKQKQTPKSPIHYKLQSKSKYFLHIPTLLITTPLIKYN